MLRQVTARSPAFCANNSTRKTHPPLSRLPLRTSHKQVAEQPSLHQAAHSQAAHSQAALTRPTNSHITSSLATINTIIMSSNLDKSLDEITGGRRGGRQGRSRRGGKSAVQVAGGVTKRTAVKASKPATQTAPTGPQPRGESKIIVSNLVSSIYMDPLAFPDR